MSAGEGCRDLLPLPLSVAALPCAACFLKHLGFLARAAQGFEVTARIRAYFSLTDDVANGGCSRYFVDAYL